MTGLLAPCRFASLTAALRSSFVYATLPELADAQVVGQLAEPFGLKSGPIPELTEVWL